MMSRKFWKILNPPLSSTSRHYALLSRNALPPSPSLCDVIHEWPLIEIKTWTGGEKAFRGFEPVVARRENKGELAWNRSGGRKQKISGQGRRTRKVPSSGNKLILLHLHFWKTAKHLVLNRVMLWNGQWRSVHRWTVQWLLEHHQFTALIIVQLL